MTNGAGRVLLGLSNQRKHCCVAYTDAQRSCSLVVTPCASSSSSPAAVLQGRLPRIAEQWLESFFKELQSSYSTQSIHKKPYLLKWWWNHNFKAEVDQVELEIQNTTWASLLTDTCKLSVCKRATAVLAPLNVYDEVVYEVDKQMAGLPLEGS